MHTCQQGARRVAAMQRRYQFSVNIIYVHIYINRAHDAWLEDSDPPCAILATRSNAAPEWFVSASRLFAPVTHSQKSSIKGLFLTLFRSLFDTF